MTIAPGTVVFSLPGVTSITIPLPPYGYECEIHYPIEQAQAEDSSRSFRRNAGNYRVLTSASWLLNPTHAASLSNFFRVVARGETIYISPGVDASGQSGFFPFGPDYTDNPSVGYQAKLLTQKPSGQLLKPMRWGGNDLSMVLTAAPATNGIAANTTAPNYAAATCSQGTFAISGVTGLPMPDGGFQLATDYTIGTALSRTGAPSSVDGRTTEDTYISNFDLTINQGNAAALIAAITAALENTTPTIIGGVTYPGVLPLYIVDPGYYVFGYDNFGGSFPNSFNAWFLGSEDSKGDEIVLKIKHDAWNRWTIPMCLQRV